MRLALMATAIVLLALAGAATAIVHEVHTDRVLYSLSDTVTITVIADDGDTVSVQVTKKVGASRDVVWNSSAKTVPMDSADGPTGYAVFSWDVASYNSGVGIYRIQVFIGGDPLTGIPTPLQTFVLVWGKWTYSPNNNGAIQTMEDTVAQGGLTEAQEESLNSALESTNGTEPAQPTPPSPSPPQTPTPPSLLSEVIGFIKGLFGVI